MCVIFLLMENILILPGNIKPQINEKTCHKIVGEGVLWEINKKKLHI